MKTYLVIITISEESYDYDILISYLKHNPCVKFISVLPSGILLKISYENDEIRRKFFSDITQLDVEDIYLHEILYEEFCGK